MTWGAVALVSAGTSLVSGYMGAEAAKSAAGTQARAAESAAQSQLQATRESNQLVRDMYTSNLGLQRPGIRAGQTALAALTGGLGLNVDYGRPTAGPSMSSVAGSQPQYINSQGQTVDANGNVIQRVESGLPDTSQYGATPEELQAASGQYANKFTETFKPSDLTTDPSYQFRLREGLRALQARGAATGMLQTGQGLRDISDYAQESASQEYGNAYNRFMKNQEALYNRLSDIAGVGQRSTENATASGTRAAETVGATTIAGQRAASEYSTTAAAARAAGTVGSTQAYTNAANQGINNWMTLQYLKGRTPTVGEAQPAGVNPVSTIG